MRKIISLLVLFVLVSSVVFAQQKGGNEPGTMTPEMRQAVEASGEGSPQPQLISAQVQSQIKAQSVEQLQQMMQNRVQMMTQEAQELSLEQKKVYQNQNAVRLATHTLLAMEDMAGKIGPQISEIARNFDNSVQATINAEEKVQKRSAVKRFFAGGDNEAAAEIEQKVQQNQAMIQQLNQLREQCDCGSEVKAMMQQQIQNMEGEQTRLQELAQKEKQSKGMFGWLWK